MSHNSVLEDNGESFDLDDEYGEILDLIGSDDIPPSVDEAMSFGTAEDRHIELLDRLDRIEDILQRLAK